MVVQQNQILLLEKTAGNPILNVNGNGNVGIGTTNPNNELEVLGGGSPRISLRTTSETVGEALELGFQVGTSANSSTNSVGIIKSVITQASPSALKGDLVFQTNSGDSVNTKMVIKDSGNVGIGTTSPTSALHVVGTQVYGGYVKFENTVHAIRLDLKSSSHTANIYMDGTGGVISGGGLIFNAPTAKTHFMESGTSKMSIISGNVGIGTTSPGSKLEVSSGVGANGDSILTISADTDNSTSSSSPKLLMLQKGSTKTSLIEMDSSDRTHFSNATGYYFSGGNVGIFYKRCKFRICNKPTSVIY